MRPSKGSMLALLGFAILGVSFALSNPHPTVGSNVPQSAGSGDGWPKDVRIVNTTDQPVPVAPVGVTRVDGTVGIAYGEPFARTLHMTLVENNRHASDIYDVPTGKLLILEFVNFEGFTPTGQQFTASVGISDGSATHTLSVPVNTKVESFGLDTWTGGLNAPVYVRAGGRLSYGFTRNDHPGTASGTLSLFGRLLDRP